VGGSPPAAPIDHVRPPFERRGEAAEGGVEHGPHEKAQRSALELVRDEKFHLTGVLAPRVKAPAVFESAERAFEILDQDLQVGPVEGDAAGEGLAHEPVGDRHVGDEELDAFRLGDALAHLERAA
jgi:hypothetical protein